MRLLGTADSANPEGDNKMQLLSTLFNFESDVLKTGLFRSMNPHKTMLLAAAFFVFGCTQEPTTKLANKINFSRPEGTALVLDLDEGSRGATRAQAEEAGLSVSGELILEISGKANLMADLNVNRSAHVIEDEGVRVVPVDANLTDPQHSPPPPDETVVYLAQKELGVLQFKKDNPLFDGRGVTVGVVDDGVSPIKVGFQKTSHGLRKIINAKTTSSLTAAKMTLLTDPSTARDFVKSLHLPASTTIWTAVYSEEKAVTLPSSPQSFDANADGEMTEIDFVVYQTQESEPFKVCVDAIKNDTKDPGECFGLFESTGEYGFWDQAKTLAIVAQFDLESQILTLSPGEREGDSHGEGVASVMAGHQLGGKFDGMAPGAQIVDFDFSTDAATFAESVYSVGSFVAAFEYLGQQHVDLANVSYSIFYTSAEAQEFMNKAVFALVTKYNMLISFSAGNNGPGLGSLNRRGMYPKNVLVAGAHVSRELDEYVHGVTGLPEEGRVVSYSSRGPGPEGGFGPTVISPLASLTHTDSSYGAFSGTSSASPALAGAAAVLISALKQSQIPVDAFTVIHAMRLSAQPLPRVHFVDQGYGLPNVARAFAIYKDLVAKKLFPAVSAAVRGDSDLPSDVTQSGVFLTKIPQASYSEKFISLNGEASPLWPQEEANAKLSPILIQYSHPWMKGPSRLWLAAGEARLSLGLDLNAIRKEFRATNAVYSAPVIQELHGSIDIIDEQSGLKIHTLPVVILNPYELNSPAKFPFVMEAEQGQRLHFQSVAGSIGAKVEFIAERSAALLLQALFYDFNFAIVDRYYAGNAALLEKFVAISAADASMGRFQMGVVRRAGTAIPVPVEVQVSPLQLKLQNEALAKTDTELIVRNQGQSLGLKLVGHPAWSVLAKKAQPMAKEGILLTAPAARAGSYKVRIRPVAAPHQSYPYYSCKMELQNAEGELTKVTYESSLSLKEEELGSLSATCFPFEITDDDFRKQDFVMEIAYNSNPKQEVFSVHGVLPPGETKLSPTWLEKDSDFAELEVFAASAFGEGEISLGTLPLY